MTSRLGRWQGQTVHGTEVNGGNRDITSVISVDFSSQVKWLLKGEGVSLYPYRDRSFLASARNGGYGMEVDWGVLIMGRCGWT